MTQFNPLVGSILQSTQVQRQQAAAKSRDARRAMEIEKNIALQDEQLEHQVESSEELKPIREERQSDHQRSRNSQSHTAESSSPNDSRPSLDLTA